MNKSIFRYFDFGFFLRFTIIYVGLYYFHLFYYALTTPTGVFYSSFLDHHLNYIMWLRSLILYGANAITHMLGFSTHIEGQLVIRVHENTGVSLNYACLGLGICSFWLAFIIAHKNSLRKKLYWSLSGIIAICFINSWRIALLLISVERRWKELKFLDHHDMFNMASYLLILTFIYCYYKADRKGERKAVMPVSTIQELPA